MAINPAGAANVSLNVFGSWCSEMSPESLPLGVSPDNQDVIFNPGQVQTRPAMQKIAFSPPLPAGTTCTYGKSFVLPTGQIKNLYLFSNGALYVEDLTNTPLTATLLFQSALGSYGKSITAFGREYIALSDGLHGTEVPLQYDGVNLDRVTQDGPAVAPMVTNYVIPATTLTTAPVLTATIVSISALSHHLGVYSDVLVNITGPNPFPDGTPIVISGTSNGALNNPWIASTSFIANSFFISYSSTVNPASTGGTAASNSTAMLTRTQNSVTAYTSAPNGLQVGYQSQISNVPLSQVATVSSIVINNEENPGIAVITTAAPHGLLPDNQFVLSGVSPIAVGGSITAYAIQPGVASVTTASVHGLTVGAQIQIALGTLGLLLTHYVDTVPTTTTFTISTPENTTASTGTTGTLLYVFPLATTVPDNFFTVMAAPTPTTLQIQYDYFDGTWSNGVLSYPWDGYFFVTSILASNGFTYQQYGPNSTTTSTGNVTPFGQIAPGKHQVSYSFLTRQGAITTPSPYATFIANGGQYASVQSLSPGPANVVGRIVQFTGADGSKFFYIPVPAVINGLTVATSTVLNDNTSTAAVFDFSDNTLFDALGVSIPGNNLANQIRIEGALAFTSYGTRLSTKGQRNIIQNLLAMSFDAGPNPTGFSSRANGWLQTAGDTSGQIIAGDVLNGWQISVTNDSVPRGTLWQSAYVNIDNAPIIQPNTNYSYRAWFEPSALADVDNFTATLSSVSTSFTSTATFLVANMKLAGGFLQSSFSAKTPAVIPSDLLLTISAQGTTVITLVVDEMNIIYADTPYLDTIEYASYVNNPEGFDGVSGKFGPSTDTHKIMESAVLRNNLYMLTQDPSGRLHQTSDNGVTEPAGWTFNEIAANCGILSAFALTKSQADDGSASGGEEWFAWASETGARIFGGDQAWKISQEIQPNWYDEQENFATQINMSAAGTIAVMNDPLERLIYFCVPTSGATAPNLIYVLNYREMDSAYAIAQSPPYHPSLSGRLVSTDNTRKWTRWNLTMNGVSRMYRQAGVLTAVFLGGNGHTPNTASGFGNIYTLNPQQLTDDDFGIVDGYWISSFIPTDDQNQALQLDSGRKMVAYATAFCSGVGNLTLTIYCDRLDNPWPLTCTRLLSVSPKFDLEFGGGYAQAQRVAFKIQPAPLAGQTDNAFNLSTFNAWFRKSRLMVRGAAT